MHMNSLTCFRIFPYLTIISL
uniref:Uncharacterized protein n=1 Tax=Arundo donax TaxID=35708 RepID=A0A0A8ZN50_ARUDO